MARGDNATAEQEVTAESEDEDEKHSRSTVKAKDLDPNERVSMMFGMPAGLKAKIEEAAEADDLPSAALVRNIVAEHFGYELPVITRGGARKKYASDEEREAARKTKAKGRRNLIRNLLEAYAKGQIQIPGLDAQVAAAEAPEDEDEEDE